MMRVPGQEALGPAGSAGRASQAIQALASAWPSRSRAEPAAHPSHRGFRSVPTGDSKTHSCSSSSMSSIPLRRGGRWPARPGSWKTNSWRRADATAKPNRNVCRRRFLTRPSPRRDTSLRARAIERTSTSVVPRRAAPLLGAEGASSPSTVWLARSIDAGEGGTLACPSASRSRSAISMIASLYTTEDAPIATDRELSVAIRRRRRRASRDRQDT